MNLRAPRFSTGLHSPWPESSLALALAPNGDFLSAQGDAVNPDPNHVREYVEFSPRGEFVAEFSIDPTAGSAFGLAIRRFGDGFIFAAVDDGTTSGRSDSSLGGKAD